MTTKRGAGGKWLPGRSPNPSGRPKVVKTIAQAIRESTEEGMRCVNLYLEIMENKKAANKDRMAAATKLLEYWIGKPTTHVKSETKIEAKGLSRGIQELLDQVKDPDEQ